MTAGDDDRRAANMAAVNRAFEAVGRGDADAQSLEYTDDAVLEFPFGDPPGRHVGREAIRQMLAGAFTMFQMQLAVDTVYDCVDPDRAVVELHSRGTQAGQPYENRYVIVFEFRHGKIASQREYFNPMPLAQLLPG